VPGGWRDHWDDPDDAAALREHAERNERRLLAQAESIGQAWQREVQEERRSADRARHRTA